MDALSYHSLSRLIAIGSTSLLQYLRDSSPFARNDSAGTLTKALKLADEEREAAEQMTRWLQKRHERIPKTGGFPSQFTTMNFCTIEYLLPKLSSETVREIAEIERIASQVQNDEVHALVQGFLDMKRRHLHSLAEFATPKTPAA